MRTAFSRTSDMTDRRRAARADEFSETSRIAVAEPVAVVGIGCRFHGGVRGLGVAQLRVTSRLRRRVHCGVRIGYLG